MRTSFSVLLIMIFMMILLSCFSGERGGLIFKANGEDFVRQGFTDKDGWDISFDHVWINLSDITAYNHKDKLKAMLKGDYPVDLAGSSDELVAIGKLSELKPGNYQSLRFMVKRADTGDMKGYSIIMEGEAVKEGRTVPFRITINEEMQFDGKEGYVGDSVKGIVSENESTEVEMTFHFDHVFGDKEAPSDSHINTASVGFDYFYSLSRNGRVDIDQKDLVSTPEYPVFVRALWTLGHLGEGHCEVSHTSTVL